MNKEHRRPAFSSSVGKRKRVSSLEGTEEKDGPAPAKRRMLENPFFDKHSLLLLMRKNHLLEQEDGSLPSLPKLGPGSVPAELGNGHQQNGIHLNQGT